MALQTWWEFVPGKHENLKVCSDGASSWRGSTMRVRQWDVLCTPGHGPLTQGIFNP